MLRAAALSHFAGRSGDIIIAPKDGWLMSTAVTTHGSQYAYDQRVPVLFFGAAVRPGRYSDAATSGRSGADAGRDCQGQDRKD